MPRRRSTKIGHITPPIDVRNEGQVGSFESMLSTGPITIVLVYADWCGHCTKFKDNTWNKVNALPNKTVNTASVHYDMLDKTSLKNAKIEGYPSLLLVGTDKKPADFRDENTGAKMNAMPMPESAAALEEVVTTPVSEPIKNATTFAQNLSGTKNATAVVPMETPMSEPPKSEPILSRSAEAIPEDEPEVQSVNKAQKKNAYVPSSAEYLGTPPDTLTDLVQTQKRGVQPVGQRGGNTTLLSSLLRITSDVAPSALLVASAAAYASRKKATRKNKSKSKAKKSRRARR